MTCAPEAGPAGGGDRASPPVVGVVLGSDSDLPVMAEAVAVLEEFGVPHEVRVLSAHRTPAEAAAWAAGAAGRGLRVIVAAAGGAAHLAGVVAAHTVLPVLGVPVAGRTLDGLDSLLSMVQMPPGVPVGVVGVNGARNAALLAVAVLAVADPELRERLEEFRRRQAEVVLQRDRLLAQLGPREYLRRLSAGAASAEGAASAGGEAEALPDGANRGSDGAGAEAEARRVPAAPRGDAP